MIIFYFCWRSLQSTMVKKTRAHFSHNHKKWAHFSFRSSSWICLFYDMASISLVGQLKKYRQTTIKWLFGSLGVKPCTIFLKKSFHYSILVNSHFFPLKNKWQGVQTLFLKIGFIRRSFKFNGFIDYLSNNFKQFHKEFHQSHELTLHCRSKTLMKHPIM